MERWILVAKAVSALGQCHKIIDGFWCRLSKQPKNYTTSLLAINSNVQEHLVSDCRLSCLLQQNAFKWICTLKSRPLVYQKKILKYPLTKYKYKVSRMLMLTVEWVDNIKKINDSFLTLIKTKLLYNMRQTELKGRGSSHKTVQWKWQEKLGRAGSCIVTCTLYTVCSSVKVLVRTAINWFASASFSGPLLSHSVEFCGFVCVCVRNFEVKYLGNQRS